jgi:probable HAF family extracellular repeat protein
VKKLAGLPIVAGAVMLAAISTMSFAQSSYTITDLGSITSGKSSYSEGRAVNATAEVTGSSSTNSDGGSEVLDGAAHAFIANCATCPLKDLDAAGGTTTTSWGFAINDSGVVVGQMTANGGYHGFVYSGGRFQDLNKLIPAGSGWVIIEAYGINASGQIVGMGIINGNEEHGYLLTPQ